MALERRRKDDKEQEVEMSAPGFSLSFKGKNQTVLLLILLILCAFTLSYGLWQHEEAGKARVVTLQKENVAHTQALVGIREEVVKQGDAIEAVIYVLSLPQEERNKLRLREPTKLREMQR